MQRGLYTSGEFARLGSVSVRTLRYYDREGLLSPSAHSEAGYRLYSRADLPVLQQILALKFLGFTLQEIRACLRGPERGLRAVLAAQETMMRDKRTQLDRVITALAETQRVVEAGCAGWDALVHVIEVMQMQQKDVWVDRYFTPEQQQTMAELSAAWYSEEAQGRLATRGGAWTEADQQRVDEQYAWLGKELRRLVAEGADPASAEAQAVARLQRDLLLAFTQGDAAVESGLRSWWQNFAALPAERRPFEPPYGPREAEFLAQAMTVLEGRAPQEPAE